MTAAPTTLESLLEDLRAEHGELDRFVSGLGAAGWDAPTPATGWAVRDQISHLAFFDDAATMAMTSPDEFARLADAALAAEGDPMAEHLRRGRAMSGPEVGEWWRRAHAAMVGGVAKMAPGVRIPWFGPPMSSLSFLSARLMETWAHGQDVADAFGVVRVPTARLRHVAHLGVRARPFSYVVRGLEPPATPVHVALEAPAGEEWEWDADGPADDSVRGPALDFCLVVTQRRHVDDTGLELEGDGARQWMSIAQAFAGAPGPGRPPLRP